MELLNCTQLELIHHQNGGAWKRLSEIIETSSLAQTKESIRQTEFMQEKANTGFNKADFPDAQTLLAYIST